MVHVKLPVFADGDNLLGQNTCAMKTNTRALLDWSRSKC